MDSTFSEKIILLVTDKLILGAIIGVAGLWATRLLERYKSSQSIREEVAKERVNRISRIWEEIIHLRKEFNLVHMNAMSVAISKSNPEEISVTYQDFRKKIEKINLDIYYNKFWLGKRLAKMHADYIKSLEFMVSESERIIIALISSVDADLVKSMEDFKNVVDQEFQGHLDIEDIIRIL
jgi:gas vesicle protein